MRGEEAHSGSGVEERTSDTEKGDEESFRHQLVQLRQLSQEEDEGTEVGSAGEEGEDGTLRGVGGVAHTACVCCCNACVLRSTSACSCSSVWISSSLLRCWRALSSVNARMR